MPESNNEKKRRSPSPRRPIPPHWKEHLDRRGIPSVRQLADRAGLSQPAANDVVFGDSKNSSEDTLAKIATALDLPLADIYWLAGRPTPHAEVWSPPAEANRLTPKQREALENLILTMVDPGQLAVASPSADAGEGATVHHLHPERDQLDVAASKGEGPTENQLRRDHIDTLGEEPQDTP